MKINFTLLLLLLTFSGLTKAGAQALYPVDMDEKVKQSSLIIEGKVVKQESFWNPLHTMIYTSNTIKVYKQFKGDPSPAFVEILTQGGSVGNESIDASDLLKLEMNETGIFLCWPNSIGLKNPASGSLLFDVYASSQGFLKYNEADGSANAPFARYKNISNDLYKTIESKTGKSHTVIDGSYNVANIVNAPTAVAITGFSPTTVNAGATLDPATNLLTINGSGFGAAAGTAAVFFDDANDGTAGNYTGLLWSSPLIVSWTATQIQVRVPTAAGTGQIAVREDGGTAVFSGAGLILNVGYSILTGTYTDAGVTVTREINLINDNNEVVPGGGYGIRYSTSTLGGGVDFNTSLTKPTFQRALTTWKEMVGFNVTELGTTTTQVINPSDNINLVQFDNTNTGNLPLASGVLATCYSFSTTCLPLTTAFAARKVEFDIVVRNAGVSTGSANFTNGPCSPATTELDMETVLLHELGHALNLGHINDPHVGTAPNANPAKLMNFAIINGVKRTSLDVSAYEGGNYATILQGNSYGNCPAVTEMTKYTPTFIDAKDECPVSFPTGSVGGSFGVNLAYATSNKFKDPQPTAVNCAATVTGVTNTAYHAFKTNNVAGSVNVSISAYATSPAAQSACAGAGVRMTLYQTATCPVGQAFPSPITCRTFNANGALAAFAGLTANTSYLLMMSGLDNTKGSFTVTLSGSVLPVRFNNFAGSVQPDNNRLVWSIDNTEAVEKTILESSIDGIHYLSIDEKIITRANVINGGFNDYQLAAKKYYRLKIVNTAGSVEYSSIVLLNRSNTKSDVIISPNPAKDRLNVAMLRTNPAGPVSFTILDMAGKKVAREDHQLQSGNVTVSLNSINKLSAGTYFLKINDGDKVSTHRVVVGE